MSRHRVLAFVGAALCAGVCVALAADRVRGDHAPAAASSLPAQPDEDFAKELWWGINLQAIGANYVTPPPQSDLIFVGEPIVAKVWLANRSKAEVKLPGRFDVIAAQVTWHLERTVDGKTERVPVRVEEMTAVKQSQIETLPPQSSGQVSVRLSDVKEPGKYRLTFSPPWGRLNHRSQDFEIIVAKTERELMDMHFRQAVRLRWAGKSAESERELRLLLTLNPNSAVAYAELASLKELPEAIECLDRAAQLAETGADKFHTLPQYAREEWASELRAEVQQLKERAAEEEKN